MRGITKLTVTEDISLVTFNQVPKNLIFTSKILSELSVQGINIDMISQSAPIGAIANISFTIDDSDIIKSLAIINKFQDNNTSIKPMVNSGNCKIQLYGEEMRNIPGVAAAVFSVISKASDEIMLVTTSEIDISILLAQHNMQEVANALRTHFELA